MDLICATDELFAYVLATLTQTMNDVLEDRLDTSPDSEIARNLWRKHDKMRTGYVTWYVFIFIFTGVFIYLSLTFESLHLFLYYIVGTR